MINARNNLIRCLAGLPSVDAVLCFGSFANGTADSYSDIDLLVLCKHQIPPTQTRKQHFKKLAGIKEFRINLPSTWSDTWNPVQDRLFYGDKWYDITYNKTSWLAKVIKQVIAKGVITTKEMPFRPYTLCGLIDNSLILTDKNHAAAKLKKLTRRYPPALRKNLFSVHRSRLVECLADLQDYVKRDVGNSAFHFQLQRFLDSFITLLFAVNETYDPASKRLEPAIKTLSTLPTNFLTRYEKILTGPFTSRNKAMLLKELDALTKFIDRHR
jgi:predicted nucleotidyltransferase